MISESNKITLYIQHTDGSNVQICFPAEKSKELTCHWLVEQAIMKLKEAFPEAEELSSIVALQTVYREYAVDHWLSIPYRNLSILRDGTMLKPYYRPAKKVDTHSTKVSLDDFIIETKLGYGAFSSVYLVRKKDTGSLYALKQVKKASLCKRKHKLIHRERQAMIDINSAHVVNLHYAFQTNNHCYFVLDFIPCGDLKRITNKKKLTENEARFYIAEAILGLNAIHSESYIYRDLKPENLLLDLDGHIRITDFGLAKKVGHLKDPNFSICGTFEILAPEVKSDAGYDCQVDYYNIGTLTYELATGTVPIFSEKERLFLEEANPRFAYLSENLKDFIKKLLSPHPESRLGAVRGFNEICAHPWMAAINMSQLNDRKIKPPFRIDPNCISFSKKPVPEAIDKVDGQLGLSLEGNTLVNFSFYGVADSIITKRRKVLSSRRESTDDTLSRNSADGGLQKKVMSEIQEGEIIETEYVSESVAARFESYKSEATKTMKVMKNFCKRGKTQRDDAAI